MAASVSRFLEPVLGMIQPPFDNNVSAAAVVIYAVACLFCFVIMLKVIGLARRKKRRRQGKKE